MRGFSGVMEVSSGYKLALGDAAPPFALKGVDGRVHTLADYVDARALVVVFSCNHCPYVRAYESRMIAFAREFASRGVAMVAINSNETENYPGDSFEHMVSRARDLDFPFDYLRDDDQSVAEAFGGACTPHFFVFGPDRRLVYQGRFDDAKDDASAVKEHYLRDAVEDVLAGREVSKPLTWAIGCSIKWRAS